MLARNLFAVLGLSIAAVMLGACSHPTAEPISNVPADTAEPVGPAPSASATTAPAPSTSAAPTPSTSSTAPTAAHAGSAQVMLKPTKGNKAAGSLTLQAESDGVRITGQITGLEPGSEHGFHVHANGDCSAPDATSAGGHFNPADQAHGHADASPHHAGDIPNQKANEQGIANINVLVHDISLDGDSDNDVVGRAIIVHAKPDDYKSQPSGDAGPRIACGVVTAASDSAKQ